MFGLDKTLPFYRLLLLLFHRGVSAWLMWVFLCFLGFVCEESNFLGFSGLVFRVWGVCLVGEPFKREPKNLSNE